MLHHVAPCCTMLHHVAPCCTIYVNSILHCVLSRTLCRKCCLILILLSSCQWKWNFLFVVCLFVFVTAFIFDIYFNTKTKEYLANPYLKLFSHIWNTFRLPTIIFQNLPQKYNLEMIHTRNTFYEGFKIIYSQTI